MRKANASMQILRKVASFGANVQDLKQIYFLFVRSQLEKSAPVWHSGLSAENINDLERVQKSAVKIILGDNYLGYRESLLKLDMETLHERRKQICFNFALKCVNNSKTKDIFPEYEKKHQMKLRKTPKYHIQNAATQRLKNSPVIYMQELLNNNEK